ncbi:MAG TPA: PEP-CTERM sorting domain-containing protein [Candidatus Acidoferrum sp.]|jgi:hypothetical protein|nr:PEP-CTERM sorting domain-containing protein [Candidatus Acidoferrum sp.]
MKRFLASLICILGFQAILSLAPQSVRADSIGADPPHPNGFMIKEVGNPGAVLQIFLTVKLLHHGDVTFEKPDGTPWTLTIGKGGTGTLNFSGNFEVKDKATGVVMTINASAIDDFQQFLNGIQIVGGPVIKTDAQAALEGAFLGSGPTFAFSPLARNLPLFPGSVPCPDFLTDLNGDGIISSKDNIFVAVNLSQWAPVASSFPLDTKFSITNGLSALLPGYYFSVTPITFNPSLGFTSSDPFSGTVFTVAEHDLSSVPEPATWLLFLGGALGAIAVTRGKPTFAKRAAN